MTQLHYCRKCKQHIESDKLEDHDARNVVSFGAILTKPKPEQFKYSKHYGAQPKKLPSKVDYRPALLAGGFNVFDQGQQGSCTANCGCADKAYHEIVQGDYPSPFSRSFLYYEERKLHGWENQDTGAEMVDIGTVLGSEGVCLNSTMPYSQFNYTTAPSQAAKSEALNWTDSPDQTRLSIADLKTALADHGPVRFGFPVPESFMNTGSDGFVAEPTDGETVVGGHAILCLGYDDALTHNGVTGYFLCVNSWGTGWGAQGFFQVSYQAYGKYDSQFGGTDNWQQLDSTPASGLNLGVSPNFLVNDGSTTAQATVSGLGVSDAFSVNFTGSDGTIIPLFHGLADNQTMTEPLQFVGEYANAGSLQANDDTTGEASNSVPFTIQKPSTCPIGNGAAKVMSFLPWVLGRKGRFRYLA